MSHIIMGGTRMCPDTINTYVGNLTSSYTDKSNEPNMVAASVIMFALAGLFFNLNLFSGISDISAILDPKVRLFLSSALSLFLPVMSYLFSEAKNNHAGPYGGRGGATTTNASGGGADLSMRAGLILAWMLLVELLRKKVDEIRMRGYSGTIQRAGRVVWLGSLVFFNIRSTGRKAVFAILWILCATRVLQKIAFTEVGKRSYAHGKNARLISSYMAQILEHENDEDDHRDAAAATGNEVLKRCNYIVMGEEMLVKIQPTADGYKLDKQLAARSSTSSSSVGVVEWIRKNDSIVTVGKVWERLGDKDQFFTNQEQRICLSFALFKLLRRRFEHLPAVSKQEEEHSRDLLLNGLYNNGETSSAEAMFQVMNDEVNFLCEYYHSVVPVVLASPFFLFLNYFLLNAVVAILCVMTVILCANGDVRYAFQSIIADNYTLKSGVLKIAICLIHRIATPSAFFSIVDLSITILLFVIYFYEEIWEFFVFLLSNWFMVSMIYNYTSKPRWLRNTTFRGTLFWVGFSIIMWLRSKMRHPTLTLKQFSVLNVRWPLKLPLFATFTGLAVQKQQVPNSVKKSIMDYLVKHGNVNHPSYDLDRGRSALRRNGLSDKLSWACRSDSIAEVILTWHIATSIMEVEMDPWRQTTAPASSPSSVEEEATFSRVVAITLSKYCAYLVAFHPELLPENPEKVELVFEEMKDELKGMIGCREYYLSPQRRRVRILRDMVAGKVNKARGARHRQQLRQNQADQMTAMTNPSGESKVVSEGVELAEKMLVMMGDDLDANGWKVLADVWTELIIYLAPSSEEERVIGHEGALVQGSEFITVLWALTTHIGVSRPPPANKLPGTTTTATVDVC